LRVRIHQVAIPQGDPIYAWLRQAGVRRHAFGEWRNASEVGVVELGPVRMATVPGLASPALGFEVRKMLDAPYRWLISMSNDNLGYIQAPGGAPSLAGPESSVQRGTSRPRPESQVGTVILDEVANLVLEMRREEASR
jgi:hypothetical protein